MSSLLEFCFEETGGKEGKDNLPAAPQGVPIGRKKKWTGKRTRSWPEKKGRGRDLCPLQSAKQKEVPPRHKGKSRVRESCQIHRTEAKFKPTHSPYLPCHTRVVYTFGDGQQASTTFYYEASTSSTMKERPSNTGDSRGRTKATLFKVTIRPQPEGYATNHI